MQKNGKMMACVCGKNVYIRKSRQAEFKYCSRACFGKYFLSSQEMQSRIKHPTGKNHPRWTGGTIKKDSGYKVVSIKGKQVYEHRYAMESHIGRSLTSEETVHHINHDRKDNRIENLEWAKRNSGCTGGRPKKL